MLKKHWLIIVILIVLLILFIPWKKVFGISLMNINNPLPGTTSVQNNNNNSIAEDTLTYLGL